MMYRWIALAMAVAAGFLALDGGRDYALAMIALAACALSAILRPGWWTFWMPLGFFEQLASDGHRADQQGPVIQLLGWIGLIALLVIGLRS